MPSHFLLTWNLSFYDRFLYHIIHDFIFSELASFLTYCKAQRSLRFSPLCLAEFQISFLEQKPEGIWCFLAWHSVISVYVCFKFQKTVVAVLTSFNYILTSGVKRFISIPQIIWWQTYSCFSVVFHFIFLCACNQKDSLMSCSSISSSENFSNVMGF